MEGELEVLDSVLHNESLYGRLGVARDASCVEVRRAYLSRSKLCHPDRLRNHPKAKEAFQSKVDQSSLLHAAYEIRYVGLSSAYQTLSDPHTRQAYDLYGKQVDGSEQTFADAVSQVFTEFLAGHFDTLIRMVDYIQSLHPDVKINKDKARQLFGSMREFVLWSGTCWGTAKFEIVRLYELQHDLHSRSYLDVVGRWRIAGQLSSGVLDVFTRLLLNSSSATSS